MIFKVAPNYTTAYHGTQNLFEWTGKTLEAFTAAMGRPHDSVETYSIGSRTISEYRWRD